MSLVAEVHKLAPSGRVDLYSLDLNSIGVGAVYYFYAGQDTDYTPIVYQGDTYQPWYVVITGIEKRGNGASPRPMAEVGNPGRFITDLCRAHQDLVGATIRRRRTLAQYVVANEAAYRDEFYLIERRAEESWSAVKFELGSPADLPEKQLPGMIAIATGCPHRYKSTAGGSGCSWPGTNPAKWFDRNGDPVGSSALDVCGKRLSDCKLRFGANSPLDYGGNPGLGRSNT
ncbi:phage minor tail protein L [Methylomonas sp. CM2]|uniref:phage minor tail protein L n=1 Tax=Methylomonas sp. CM2 TaxID=3417647 RepID=UPI003CF46DFB